MKKAIALISILLALAASYWVFVQSAPLAPNQLFTTIDGRSIELSSLRGRPVLVNFWSTGCPPCIRELPELAALYRDQHDKGLEIIAVAMPYDRPDHVVEMAKAKQIPYPVAVDVQGLAVKAFEVRGVPAHFLIDRHGQLILRQLGRLDTRLLAEILETLSPEAS